MRSKAGSVGILALQGWEDVNHLTTANKRFYENLKLLVDWTDQAKGAGTPHVVWNTWSARWSKA